MRRSWSRPALAVFAVALLAAASGCAVTSRGTAAPAAPPTSDWPQRRLALQGLSAWDINGRIAVAATEGREGWTASLDWRRRGESSVIDLRGPLGAGAVRVTVEGAETTVDDGRGPPRRYTDLEAGLAAGLGAPLPIASLRYWVLGVPDPALPSIEAQGAEGWLATLEQDGWSVRFERYGATPLGWLPARVVAEHEGLRLRLAIESWGAPAPGASP